MSKLLKNCMTIVFILCMLPIIITLILNRQEAIILKKEIDVEKYIPALVYMELPSGCMDEAIKSQAIITRTNVVWRMKNESKSAIFKEVIRFLKRNVHNMEVQKEIEYISEVIHDTEGKVLKLNGEICDVPFHRVSAGMTRNGEEAFLNKDYNYLSGVKSAMDVESSDYMKGHFFTPDILVEKIKEEFKDCKINSNNILDSIEIVSRDSAGYVLQVRLENITVSGEALRECLNLNSSNFTINKYENSIRFLCKGLGHGVGMSQYGANILAIQGYKYEEILSYYYTNLKISQCKI